MSDKGLLIVTHSILFILQIVMASLAIVVDPKFASISAPIGVAQAFFPNPFRKE